MSHRDKDCRTPSDSYAQELSSAIQGLLANIDWTGVHFRKDCGWVVTGLVAAALVWAWSAKSSLTQRFDEAMKFARQFGPDLAPAKTSYQAFMKLLVRWTAELRRCLLLRFQRRMAQEFPNEFRFAGYVLLGGDGSKQQLARTVSNEATFSSAKTRQKQRRQKKCKKGRPSKQNTKSQSRQKTSRGQRAKQARAKKADSPQLALTVLYHLLLRLPWDWRLGSYDASERQHVRDMMDSLPQDALVAADCGFVGYDFWSALLASGRAFVIRVGGNVRMLKNLGVVKQGDGIVYLWPDKTAKKGQPPLVLRLVVVDDGRQRWYLVTSVLEPQRLSDQQVAQIYGYRWRIELFFRHLKQTFGRAKLRSHKGEHSQCEAEWSLLGLSAMLLHAQLQLPPKDRKVGRLSVARMLRAFGYAIEQSRSRPQQGDSLSELLAQAVIDRYRRRNKTSRNYPRKKYESEAKAPHLRNATPSERRLAKKLMTQIV